MGGYYKLPDETAAVFDDEGFFKTGDMGRIDADGHLYITGRIKEMLIIAGENVFPRELEEVLNAHPAVQDSAVIGMQDPTLCVPTCDLRHEVLLECAAEVVYGRVDPVSAGGGVVNIHRPGVHDRLTLQVGLEGEPGSNATAPIAANSLTREKAR